MSPIHSHSAAQMVYTSEVSSHQAQASNHQKTIPPLGLKNVGNTDCFVNAVRQFVYNTPIKCLISERFPIKALYRDFQCYRQLRRNPKNGAMGGSATVRSHLVSDAMQNGQQSAHELLMQIFNNMPYCLSNGKPNPLFNSIEHLRANGVKNRKSAQPEGTIVLPVQNKAGQVINSMQKVWDHYVMMTKNDHNEIEKYWFQKLPDHLFFYFSRNFQNGAKINSAISAQPTFRFDFRHVKTLKQGESADFSIQAFIIHEGSATAGHYRAYVLCKKQWFHCNDSIVTKVSLDDAIKAMSHASVFYAKRIGLTGQQVEDPFVSPEKENKAVRPLQTARPLQGVKPIHKVFVSKRKILQQKENKTVRSLQEKELIVLDNKKPSQGYLSSWLDYMIKLVDFFARYIFHVRFGTSLLK